MSDYARLSILFFGDIVLSDQEGCGYDGHMSDRGAAVREGNSTADRALAILEMFSHERPVLERPGTRRRSGRGEVDRIPIPSDVGVCGIPARGSGRRLPTGREDRRTRRGRARSSSPSTSQHRA